MQELPSHVIAGANKVVVESKEAALEETGDLQVPIKKVYLKRHPRRTWSNYKWRKSW